MPHRELNVSADIDIPRACCACGETKISTRNLYTLSMKAPVPGTGWGCIVCHLPSDGAVAVVCDDCHDADAPLHWALAGFLASGGRIPIGDLKGTHQHNPRFHPEMAVRN